MNDADLQDVLASFYVEAAELMVQLEASLLCLEDTPDSADELNALFRTVHTVKGTAGLFGLNEVVAFTHQVETVLDKLREGQFKLSPALSSLLLACKDHIQALLDLAQREAPVTPELKATDAALLQQLQALQLSGVVPAATPANESAPLPAPVPALVPAATLHRWHLNVAFGANTYGEGGDPLAALDFLRELGEVIDLATTVHVDAEFEDMDPELCRLGMDFVLQSTAERSRIESAFWFMADSCVLNLRQLQDPPPEAIPVVAAATAAAAAVSAPAPAAVVAAGAAGAATAAAPEGVKATAPRQEDGRMVRVPAEKLDQLINLVGELVIAGSGTSALARKHRLKDLLTSTAQLNGLIEDIRDRALSLRMVAVGETFSRFRRVVRDLSAKLGKQVELELVGTDAELDKSMLEGLNDPLVHIVRNSLDHGIEMPEERVAAGKPAMARLVLAAQHEAGGVVIRVTDDGAGLNRERIFAKAVERGLVARDAQLGDDEVHELIFAPGFSTAEAVTDLSGRGVGMDVVRRAIEGLRGTVRLRSVRGQGTTVEMRLPLTLAIIDGFHVRVAEHQFVLPMDEVVECINTRNMAPPVAGQITGHLSLRGSPLPVLHLRELFELHGEPAERQSIVVVRCGSQQLGLVTDTLMGEGQTVIKPMSELFQRLEGIAGSTVLGTGEVALILDVPALVALAARSESRAEPHPFLEGQKA